MSVQPAAFKLIIYQNKGGNICHVGCNDGSKCVRYSWPHVCTLSVCLCFILHAHNLKHDLFPQSFVTVVQLDGHETHVYFQKKLFLFYGHLFSIHLDKSFSCSTNQTVEYCNTILCCPKRLHQRTTLVIYFDETYDLHFVLVHNLNC